MTSLKIPTRNRVTPTRGDESMKVRITTPKVIGLWIAVAIAVLGSAMPVPARADDAGIPRRRRPAVAADVDAGGCPATSRRLRSSGPAGATARPAAS